jgi:Zeta toxin
MKTNPTLRDIAQDYMETSLLLTERQQTPTAYIVAGQPGAGASLIASDIEAALMSRGGAVVVSTELAKSLIPDEVNTPPHALNSAARSLAEEIRKQAVDNNRNIIDLDAANQGAGVNSVLQLYKHHGYQNELHAAAVNEQVSYARATTLQLMSGNETHIEQSQHTSQANHAVHAVHQAIAEHHPGATNNNLDKAVIYDRLNQVTASSEHTSGSEALSVYNQQRQTLNTFERYDLAQTWDEIQDRRAQQGQSASPDETLAYQRAHYLLRITEPNKSEISASPSARYDHEHPERASDSKDAARAYGASLARAFQEKNLRATERMPELKDAFALSAASAKHAQATNTDPQAYMAAMNKSITQALSNGARLPPAQLRQHTEPQKNLQLERE